jgi:hypothetical protein
VSRTAEEFRELGRELRQDETGAFTNSKVERFALMLADGILSPYKCFVITHSSRGGNLPGGKRQQNIMASPAFKARVEELRMERERLEGGDIWDQLEWQARQTYRRACALEDLSKQMAATELLMRVALRGGRAAKETKPEAEEGEEAPKRGRGAPSIETPEPADIIPNYRAARLIEK